MGALALAIGAATFGVGCTPEGAGASAGSTSAGGGVLCDPARCPPPSNECVDVVCTAEDACGETPKTDGVLAATQIAGDCKRSVCKAGALMDEADDADVRDDGNACTDDTCTAGMSVATPKADGDSCGTGSICSATNCVAGCFIDGTFVAPNTTSPTNVCTVCAPDVSTSTWSNQAEGFVCGENRSCAITPQCIGCTIIPTCACSGLLGLPNPAETAITTSFTTGSAPFDGTTADLNGDGFMDIVTANLGSDTVSVLLGNGDGTFAPNVEYPAALGPLTIAVADLNGDNHLDVVVGNYDTPTVTVFLAMGMGHWRVASISRRARGLERSPWPS